MRTLFSIDDSVSTDVSKFYYDKLKFILDNYNVKDREDIF